MSIAGSMPMHLARVALEGSDPTLTELKTLKLLALGYTQVEAAEKMGKSFETVRKQMKCVRARLNAKTNTQAVAIAISLDMI